MQVLIGTNDNELQQRLLGSGAFSIPAEFLINDIRKVRWICLPGGRSPDTISTRLAGHWICLPPSSSSTAPPLPDCLLMLTDSTAFKQHASS